MGLPYVWPYFAYDYIKPLKEEEYLRVVDESINFEILDKVTVYETIDSQHRIVAEYQERDIQRKYSFIDIQYSASTVLENYLYFQPQYITACDEEEPLAIKEATMNKFHGLFYNNYNLITQRAYQNPSSKDIKITVVFTIDKVVFNPIEEAETVLKPNVNFSLNIHKYKYGSLPNNPESVFDNFVIDKDGKLGREEENDIQ